MEEKKIRIGKGEASLLCGTRDKNLKIIERALGVKIILRDNFLKIRGEELSIKKGEKVIKEILSHNRQGNILQVPDINYILKMHTQRMEDVEKNNFSVIFITPRGRKIKPRTEGQKRYVETIKKNEVVFSIGPAGTGKTYLAAAMAVSALQNGEVIRIILTRPTVEVGEKLGYLPGKLEEKVEPYLRPLYDALYDMILTDKFQNFLERGIIEIAPLAYMRGRTLNDAFIILDEAQNTTYEQMKMFLTRLGFGSRAVITGDITQIDLSPDRSSGLVEVQNLFKEIGGITTVYLTQKDVVRHHLVQKIVKTYEEYEKNKKLSK